MLDEWGTPQITDFGLSVLATVNNQQFSSNRGGDWHFLAPEILGAEKKHSPEARPTTKSDMYSFAIVVIEVRGSPDIIACQNLIMDPP